MDNMDYEKFCRDILDSDDKIRFATVYDQWAERVAGGMRPGIQNLLTDRQEKELVTLSVLDWKQRKEMAKWLGKTIYTMAEFEQVKRFSFYLGDDDLLLVSTEKEVQTKKTVDDVIRLYYENKSS